MATNHQRIDSHLGVLRSRVPFTFTEGELTITITEASKEGNALKVMCEATGPDGPLELDLPFYYVNPPMGVRDGDKVRVDVQAAVQAMVADTVRLFA